MHKRTYRDAGYVTLFTCLLMAVFIIFVMFALEIVCWQMAEVRAEEAVTSNIKSLFGDYVQCIYDDYHLLVIDGSYQTGSMAYLEERLSEQLKGNLQNSLSGLTLKELLLTKAVKITDENFAALKKQLHDYCGYAMTEDLLELIRRRNQGDVRGEVETSPETEDIAIDTETCSNPGVFLNGMIGNVLLSIVCPAGQLPSQKVTALEGLPSGKAKIKSEDSLISLDFLNGSGVLELISQVPLDLSEMAFSMEALELVFYIRSCFHTWIDHGQKGPFRGEQEYILYGNDTDWENVLQAVQGIILIRMPFNYSYLCSSPSKRAAVKTAAAAIAVLTGSTTGFAEQLLLGAVSYGEGVLDVKALLHGEAVPLLKTGNNWRLSITDFFKSHLLGRNPDHDNKGLLYEDYLTLLLLLKGNGEKLYYRLLDLMTLAAQAENENFSMDFAVTDVTLHYSIESAARFSSIPKSCNPEAYLFFYEKSLGY